MKYFLVGYMACGKTTYGKAFAMEQGIRFIDLDQTIEERAGCSIPQLFATEGEGYFREMERDVLHDEAASNDDFVMATGGGTPCFFDNMDYMNNCGETIFLDTPMEILVERLRQERESHPMLTGITDSELRQFIEQHHSSRLPFYLKAKHKIN